ncbi:hypothetical protein G9A89_011756 [Geosiphon pyriformis]|nr:hypothetical protein G9A89_011756 [Geosiphon pyriformis]
MKRVFQYFYSEARRLKSKLDKPKARVWPLFISKIIPTRFAKLPSDPTNKSLPQFRHKPYSGSKDTLPAGPSTTISYGPLNNTHKPEMADLTLRIAGGWVRDKLLGLECNDLDVALSLMMGFEFAKLVNKYLCENNYPVSSIGKIEKNPDRSKHLQTAATKVLGLEVDFVNLRSEVYQEDSRIPKKVVFGTPKEDALRRDITINALFYNIHTRQVEDFTEKGLEDLSLGLIRTPLPAYQTFLDDPLRVLRCIRFASRFHFSIVDEILETVKNEVIRVALLSKISRERVGIEIDKMIKASDPLHSFELIQSFNLYEIIFIPPSQTTIISGIIHKPIMGVNVSRILKWLISSGESTLDPDISIRPLAEVRSLYLASILVPYLNVVVQDGKREVPAVSSIIRKSLKLPNSDIDNITKLFDAMGPLNSAAIKNEATPLDRVYLGLLIRKIGDKWPMALILGLALELLPKGKDIEYQPTLNENSLHMIQRFNKLINRIRELGLQDAYEIKPIINGKEIIQLLDIRMGPGFKEYQQWVLEWQLEHPEGTKEKCKEYIKDKYKE